MEDKIPSTLRGAVLNEALDIETEWLGASRRRPRLNGFDIDIPA